MKKIMILLGSSLLLAACSANKDADTTTVVPDETAMAAPDDAMPPAMPTDAKSYLAMAGASDMWEIESSKALLAKSSNTDVKMFAQMMVDHHTASTEKVKAAAKTAKLAVAPPMLDADQKRMLDEIKSSDAKTVDAVYVRNQKMAHDKALALHQGYAANGDTPSLKAAAGEIAPVVQQHISALGKLPAA